MSGQLVDSKPITDQSDTVAIDRDQIRAARAALGWSAAELAERSRLGVATIRRAESDKPPGVSAGDLFVIQHTFEDFGIVFLDDDQASPGGGRGIRWRQP